VPPAINSQASVTKYGPGKPGREGTARQQSTSSNPIPYSFTAYYHLALNTVAFPFFKEREACARRSVTPSTGHGLHAAEAGRVRGATARRSHYLPPGIPGSPGRPAVIPNRLAARRSRRGAEGLSPARTGKGSGRDVTCITGSPVVPGDGADRSSRTSKQIGIQRRRVRHVSQRSRAVSRRKARAVSRFDISRTRVGSPTMDDPYDFINVAARRSNSIPRKSEQTFNFGVLQRSGTYNKRMEGRRRGLCRAAARFGCLRASSNLDHLEEPLRPACGVGQRQNERDFPSLSGPPWCCQVFSSPSTRMGRWLRSASGR